MQNTGASRYRKMTEERAERLASRIVEDYMDIVYPSDTEPDEWTEDHEKAEDLFCIIFNNLSLFGEVA
jgi:hypothetical protein